MFRIDARKTVLAFSLFAAVGALLPGSHPASAAAIPATDSASNVQVLHAEQTPPGPHAIFGTLTWEIRDPIREINGITTYRFRLHAHGGPIGNVRVEKTYFTNIGYNPTYVHGPFTDNETLGTMVDGEWKDVYLMCKPEMQGLCSVALVRARSHEGLDVTAEDDRNGQTRATNVGY